MRLTEAQRYAITDAIHDVDPDAPVYLFGSRANTSAKGGDIDLLVLSSQIDLMAKLDILSRLHRQHVGRKSDSAFRRMLRALAEGAGFSALRAELNQPLV